MIQSTLSIAFCFYFCFKQTQGFSADSALAKLHTVQWTGGSDILWRGWSNPWILPVDLFTSVTFGLDVSSLNTAILFFSSPQGVSWLLGTYLNPSSQLFDSSAENMSLPVDHDSFDANANKGPTMIRVCVAMICLSSIGVCGRFIARWLTKQPLLWDDWLIVVALIFSWGCCVIQIIGSGLTRVMAAIANERP